MADNKKENRKGRLVLAAAPPGYSDYKVLACHYSVAKHMSDAEPTGAPFVQDYIKLTIETAKNVKYLRDWALSGEEKWGTISMVIAAGTKGSTTRKMRYIYFGGRVKTINEYFNSLTSQMMTTTLYIVPVAVNFAESDGKAVRLLTESGTVVTDATAPINDTKIPIIISGYNR